MKSSELEALKEKLLNLRREFLIEGGDLLERAERLERLYGQETARSRSWRKKWQAIIEVNEALLELENGNPEKALAVLGEK